MSDSRRSVRVWLMRDSGQFWPSVCHYMGAAASSLFYHHATRRLFVGIDSGMKTICSVNVHTGVCLE